MPRATGSVLLVVDVQNDFCPGGTLAVARGDDVVRPLNWIARRFRAARIPVVFSRDWHPARTKHFEEFGGAWPPHCLQGTRGADFHPRLAVPRGATIMSKGMDPEIDAYSCFQATMEDGTPFPRWLADHGIRRLYIGGLATDYCVLQTTLDARRKRLEVVVLEDAIRAVDMSPGDGDRAITGMRHARATFRRTADVIGGLGRTTHGARRDSR